MKITKELVIAFFEDRCSKEEAEAIHWYLQENPGLLHDYFPDEEWLGFKVTEDRPEKWAEKVWKNIQAEKGTPGQGKINIRPEEATQPGRVRFIDHARFRYITRIAAAMAVVTVGFCVFKQFGERAAKPRTTLAAALPAENRDTVLINPTKKIRRDTLTDGSVVELSPASTLRLRWDFEGDKRAVGLSGEALFNVARDAHRPFTVITRGFTTTVLGTIFRIKAYTGSNRASVRLIKGKVVVRNLTHPSQAEFLLAGEECTFDNSRNSLSRTADIQSGQRPAAAAPEIGQLADGSSEVTDKEILFKNLPLPRVLTILSETYHSPIQFTNADLLKRKFTGSIQKDQSLEDALGTIAQLNDLLVIRQDNSYRISLRR